MERTQSFLNLSTVPHDLRNTAGRQARRAAQAAAPLPIPTSLAPSNPVKIPENVPLFLLCLLFHLRLFLQPMESQLRV